MYITKEQAINAMKTDPHQFERISILADRCNVKLKGAENMTFFAAITTADGKALLDELLATLAANKCSCIIYNKRDGWRGEMVAGDIPQKIGIRGAAKVLPVKKEEIFAAAAPVQERTEVSDAAAAVLGVDVPPPPVIWEFGRAKMVVNGEVYRDEIASYIPADNGYVPDKSLTEKALTIIANRQPILVEGHTGCGKSEFIKWLAHKTNNPLLVIQGSEDMETSTLLGHLEIDESGTYWVDGLITTAVKEGLWLYFDEVNSCPAGVKIALHGLLDDSRHIILADHRSERVKAHPNFRFLAACNPADHGGYLGAGFENVAFLNRFMKLRMPYLPENAEYSLMKSLFPALDADMILKVIKGANLTRGGFMEGKIGNVVSTRDLKMAFHNALTLGVEDALCILGGKFGSEDAKRFYDAFTISVGPLEAVRKFLNIS